MYLFDCKYMYLFVRTAHTRNQHYSTLVMLNRTQPLKLHPKNLYGLTTLCLKGPGGPNNYELVFIPAKR